MKKRKVVPVPPPQPWTPRRFRRHRLPLPITVRPLLAGDPRTEQYQGITENISAGGIYFYAPEGTEPSEQVELIIPVVRRMFHPAQMVLRCQARVLRRELTAGGVGMAAQFEKIEFLRHDALSGVPLPMPIASFPPG